MTPLNEPIAIIGSGCRFPGNANSPSRLWELLREPKDCRTEIPKDRFNWEGYYSEKPFHGSIKTKYSHFLDDIRRFDPQFFNIQPAEAEAIDPQQRLLLETVYEALENAGLTIEGLQGSSTAVYVGLMNCDYTDLMQGDIDILPKYTAPGIERSIDSNRISYFFDWHGPSMTIDTACSSSMVALHLAVQSLRSGESNVAIACGASLIISPQNYIAVSNVRMISADGRSKMWDESADGYARGEGVASIVLKRLSAAIADGDSIDCIIRETGVNHDGRTRGITMPSSIAQADLIRKTYERAGLDISKRGERPQYFEAHGTGTQAGDLREAEAVHNAFFAGCEDGLEEDDAIHVGSIKTVIGHTEGTAGLAGVLKAALALKYGYIPPNMLFEKMNPSVAPYAKHLRLPTALAPWPSLPEGVPRRASVNSFGFGGSNGHAVLESYEITQNGPMQAEEHHGTIATPFVFSAESERSLVAVLREFSQYLQDSPGVDLRSVAWTLQCKRSTLGVRTAIVALNADDLLLKISDTLARSTEMPIGIKPTSKRKARILGIFTGQGAQWAGMAQELLRISPKAREIATTLDRSLASLPREKDRPSWSIEEELMKDSETSRIGEATISQPLCTAVQILLVDMLTSAGIGFHAVIGHSAGEIGAAYAAGIIDAPDAIRIAYYRGMNAKLAGNGVRGAMMATGLSPTEARALCASPRFSGRLFVAACNSSASATISGDHDAIEEAKAELDEKNVFASLLKVDTAYHSHHMIRCAEPYLDALQSCGVRVVSLQPAKSSPVWISSVYAGEIMSPTQFDLTGKYWVANMTQSVLFDQAVETAISMLGESWDMALEIGPHPVLKSAVLETIQCKAEVALPYSGVLTRGKNDLVVFAQALGMLWTHCEPGTVDFARYDRTFFSGAKSVSFVRELPTYPWDHERSYWFEARSESSRRNRRGPIHRLLGVPYGDATDTETRWRNFLIPQESPWLIHHRLQGRAVLPGAAYAVMACEAALLKVQGQKVRLVEIRDMAIHRAISFDDDATKAEIMFTLSSIKQVQGEEDQETWTASWTVQSPTNEGADKLGLISSGSISLLLGQPEANFLPGRAADDLLLNMVSVDVDEFYNGLNEIGYGYTEAFRAIHRLQWKTGHATGWFEPQSPFSDAIIHPALLDVAFQALAAATSYPGSGGLRSLHMPTGIRAIRLNPYHVHKTETMFFDVTLPNASATGDVTIYTAAGDAFIQAESVASVPFTKATKADDRNIFSEEIWATVDPDASLLSIDRATVEETERAYACERAAHFYLKRLRSEITISEECNAAAHHQQLLAWAAHITSDVASGDHPYARVEWTSDTEDDIVSLFETYADDIDLKVIRSVGQAYPSIVRGKSDPLEHIIEDNILYKLYTDGLGFSVANDWAARLVQQISHRDPHMNIIDLGANTAGATRVLLHHLDSAFESYTFTDTSTARSEKIEDPFGHVNNKVITKSFDIEEDPSDQGFEKGSYDLAVAWNVTHAAKDVEKSLNNIRSLLKPGGYLVLVELTNQNVSRVGFIMRGLAGWWHSQEQGGRRWAPTLTTAQWHILLQRTGYSGIDTIAMAPKDELAFPFSVFVSQAIDDRISFLRQPLFARNLDLVAGEMGDLLIVGGTTLDVSRIATEVQFMLDQRFRGKMVVNTLEEVNTLVKHMELPTTILILTELESSMFKKMTAARLRAVKAILTDYRNVLWVTQGCQGTEPYNNMTVGLGRSASNEQKDLRLQFLDVEEGLASGALDARRLSEMLLRLRVTQLWERDRILDQIVWTTEPEIRTTKNNKLVIPRMYQHEAQNCRYNSKQRQIFYHARPANDRVCITYSEPTSSWSLVKGAAVKTDSLVEPLVSVRVMFSLLCALRVADNRYLFPVVGKCSNTAELVFALAKSNASLVNVPQDSIIPLHVPCETAKVQLLLLVWEMVVRSVILNASAGEIILTHGVESNLLKFLDHHAGQHSIAVVTVVSDPQLKSQARSIFIHPLEFGKVLQAKLPSKISVFLDLSSSDAKGGGLHSRLVSALPVSCHVHTAATLLSASSVFSDGLDSESLRLHELISQDPSDAHGISILADSLTKPLSQVSVLSAAKVDSFTIIDWVTHDTVLVNYEPVDRGLSFPSDKTYLLVGLTGDLGQSLCEWMVEHGARNLVLASRNPKVGRKWLDSMEAAGATVKVFAMDVTSKASIQAVYEEMRQTMPPIAGVANAAMVMQDIMLSNMELHDLQTVMKPKVDGSRHLSEIFDETHPLDFFILFSSLSFIIGNSGQSSYAAANAYMASLVCQRRAQGLAGSVMHIGAIMGAGYITRVRQFKPGDLEASGSYPLSPADFNQLFGEAVLASPPHSGLQPDITTGLRTIDPGIDDRVLWRSNAKFSHFWKSDGTKSDRHNKQLVAPVKDQLAEVTTRVQARDIIQAIFSARLVVLLRLDPDDMDDNAPLVKLGVDSLVAVEARSWFMKQMNIDISVLRILGGACVVDLVGDVMEKIAPELLPKVKAGYDEVHL